MTVAPRTPSDLPIDRTVDALDAATRAVAGVLDLDRVLQVIVDLVRPLVAARYAALGIVGSDGVIERFITSGMDNRERDRIGHIPVGLGLLGLIVRENRPIRVADLMRDPRRHGFPAHHPPMHSFLGVPVTIRGVSVGNLYLTEKQDGEPFTDEDERIVENFALHAAIAIERARLHAEIQRLVIVDERERISRDLHDGIIQGLYAVSLTLEDMPDMLAEDPEGALERVERAIDSIHANIRDIRNFITGLQPEALESGDLTVGLTALAQEARNWGFRDVHVDVGIEPELAASAKVDLLQAAREAVSNAMRHSGASSLELRLFRGEDEVILEVVDDGRGFETALPAEVGHHGLANLRARAIARGGELTVESSPGKGTRVRFRLPEGHARSDSEEASD